MACSSWGETTVCSLSLGQRPLSLGQFAFSIAVARGGVELLGFDRSLLFYAGLRSHARSAREALARELEQASVNRPNRPKGSHAGRLAAALHSPVAAHCGARDHLAAVRDDRMRTTLWWRVVASYGWSIAVRELETSPRWSPSAKAKAGVLTGIAISFPVTFGIGLPYLYWLLTGRGPWQRYGFSSAVVVNPFPRRIPAEVRAALAELGTERAGGACPAPSHART